MSQITKEVILTSDINGENYSAAVWDPENGSQLFAYKNAGALEYRTLQLLSDSYLLGASVAKSRIHIWPLNSPVPLNNIRLNTPGKVHALTCTPNGSYLIAAIEEKLIVWQTCNGRILANLSKHYQTITCVSTTKDGSVFASGGQDGLVFVWSLFLVLNNKNCSPIHKFSHHNLPIQGLCFGHGGACTRLYTISLDGKANIYEVSSGDLLLSLIYNVPLTAIAVNICDSELFVGCINGNILQCNLHNPPRGIEQHVNTDEESMVFKAHKSNVTALSISVNCRILVSGSTDKAVHVWDIASKQVLRTMEHKGPVTAAFFAMRYENFRASVLNPRLVVCSLQNEEIADKDTVIRVISRGRNLEELIDFKSYVDSNSDPDEQEDVKELENIQEELEKLKSINAKLYQYSVMHILDKIKNNGE
jgi:pre-rRNA-processing protein IPI3